MDTVPSFDLVSDVPALLRCATCGGVVDASEHARSLHRAWHASLAEATIDLPALEGETSLNIA